MMSSQLEVPMPLAEGQVHETRRCAIDVNVGFPINETPCPLCELCCGAERGPQHDQALVVDIVWLSGSAFALSSTRTFEMRDIVAALKYLESGQHIGKTVIRVG
jgi:hypothetical protein